MEAVIYEDGKPGPARVWLGDRPVPGLAMSRYAQPRRGPPWPDVVPAAVLTASFCRVRSFGDLIAKQAGVVSRPQIVARRLQGEDAFLVVASDGLWEFMSNQDVATLMDQTSSVIERKGEVCVVVSL